MDDKKASGGSAFAPESVVPAIENARVEPRYDEKGLLIPTEADKAALRAAGFEIVIGNGNDIFGVRKD